MIILRGIYKDVSYDGKIIVNGEEVQFNSIKESQDAGIAIIYQELALVPELTIAENIFLGSELMSETMINWNYLYTKAQKWLSEVGIDIDPHTKLSDLTVGNQQ